MNLDEITDKVIQQIHCLGFGPIGSPTLPEHKLNEDLGMDSLDMLELSLELEKEFGIAYEIAGMTSVSISDVVNQVALALASK
jgi:acyl carrier protein